MSVVPPAKLAKIGFYENHISPWSLNSVAVGTTAAEVTALQTKTEAARDAYNAAIAARDAAKAATLAYDNAVAAMADAGADIIKQIRAKAATAGSNVYVLAQIPAPAIPTPVGPPGTPFDFSVELLGDGSLELRWKCNNPAGSAGTMYQVYRRIGPGGAGEFVYCGGNGSKKFLDATLPAGSAGVTYQIQAVRSTSTGPWAQFNVNFGVGGGGMMTASVVAGPTKIAA